MSLRRSLLIFIVILTGCQSLQALERVWWKKGEPKIKVKSVVFTGNREMPDFSLYQIMVLRPSRFLRPTIFHPDLVQGDLNSIIRYYNQQGYLYAEIVDHDETVDSVNSAAHISISFKEGPRTFLESINMLGNAVFTDSLLSSLVELKPGDPLLSRQIETATLILLRHYADAGYLDATIVPTTRVNAKTNLAILDFDLNERQQFSVGKITIIGLEKTRENVIRRELLFHTGEVANYSKLLKSQRKIYLTGLAESVFVNPQPAADGDSTLKDILVEIKEVEAGEFNVSLGYGSLDHLRTSMGFHQDNLKGTARKIGIKGRLSSIQQGIEASFSEPWTFHQPWRSDIILTRENLVEPTYNLSRLGLRAAIGRNFTDFISLTFSYRDERNRLSNIQIDTSLTTNIADIRSLKMIWVRDSRDNLFDPHEGTLFEWNNEIAGGYLQGANSFFRSDVKYRWFLPILKKSVLGGAIEIAWLNAFNGMNTISLNERLYAGGPNSIRGFGYQMVSPLDELGNPIGGGLRFVWNIAEWRFPVYKFLDGGVFLDAGNVWQSPESFKISDVRFAPGVGIRINSPLGLARLDVGWDPSATVPGKAFQIWFSMGYSF